MRIVISIRTSIFAALIMVAVVSAPVATAAPSCDPTSAQGQLNCIGGGVPWQDQAGSSPDTYGPAGERGFLNDALMRYPNDSPESLLKFGRGICGLYAQGLNDLTIEDGMVQAGVNKSDARYLTTISRMYLC